MSSVMVPANMDEALKMLESAVGFMADAPAAELPVQVVAEGSRAMERSRCGEGGCAGPE
jgi:hypothetical protein